MVNIKVTKDPNQVILWSFYSFFHSSQTCNLKAGGKPISRNFQGLRTQRHHHGIKTQGGLRSQRHSITASKHKGECTVPLKVSLGESSGNLLVYSSFGCVCVMCNTSTHASLEEKCMQSYWEKNLDNRRTLKAHRLCQSGSMRHKSVNIYLGQNKS